MRIIKSAIVVILIFVGLSVIIFTVRPNLLGELIVYLSERPYNFKGQTVDGKTGEPIRNANVCFKVMHNDLGGPREVDYKVSTDNNGQFRIPPITTSMFDTLDFVSICADKQKYFTQTQRHTLGLLDFLGISRYLVKMSSASLSSGSVSPFPEIQQPGVLQVSFRFADNKLVKVSDESDADFTLIFEKANSMPPVNRETVYLPVPSTTGTEEQPKFLWAIHSDGGIAVGDMASSNYSNNVFKYMSDGRTLDFKKEIILSKVRGGYPDVFVIRTRDKRRFAAIYINPHGGYVSPYGDDNIHWRLAPDGMSQLGWDDYEEKCVCFPIN